MKSNLIFGKNCYNKNSTTNTTTKIVQLVVVLVVVSCSIVVRSIHRKCVFRDEQILSACGQ